MISGDGSSFSDIISIFLRIIQYEIIIIKH